MKGFWLFLIITLGFTRQALSSDILRPGFYVNEGSKNCSLQIRSSDAESDGRRVHLGDIRVSRYGCEIPDFFLEPGRSREVWCKIENGVPRPSGCWTYGFPTTLSSFAYVDFKSPTRIQVISKVFKGGTFPNERRDFFRFYSPLHQPPDSVIPATVEYRCDLLNPVPQRDSDRLWFFLKRSHIVSREIHFRGRELWGELRDPDAGMCDPHGSGGIVQVVYGSSWSLERPLLRIPDDFAIEEPIENDTPRRFEIPVVFDKNADGTNCTHVSYECRAAQEWSESGF